jgi:hypothetical protein
MLGGVRITLLNRKVMARVLPSLRSGLSEQVTLMRSEVLFAKTL